LKKASDEISKNVPKTIHVCENKEVVSAVGMTIQNCQTNHGAYADVWENIYHKMHVSCTVSYSLDIGYLSILPE
jgi:hypothetical protein